MEEINKKLFIFINNLSGNYYLDNFFIFFAKFTPLIFVAVLISYFFSSKKYKSLYAFYSSMLGLFINFLISQFYFHPRPFVAGSGHTLIYHSPDSSFPSDHATLCFSIAFSFILFKEKKIRLTLTILSLILSFSRIYVGVHYPYDILGSIIVSFLSASLIKIFSNKLKLGGKQ